MQRQGLYDPNNEHDACGMGFVVNLGGQKSHEIVRKGIEILVNLTHRGACGCDPETGDGAGILFQIPHEFFARECGKLGFELPSRAEYGVGVVFLSADPAGRKVCEDKLAEIIVGEGQELLGWRDVPVMPSAVGVVARSGMPIIRQFFIQRRGEFVDQQAFERKLFVIRKWANRRIKDEKLAGHETFYIPSLSSRTVIYKG